jgi:hypothetical protein
MQMSGIRIPTRRSCHNVGLGNPGFHPFSSVLFRPNTPDGDVLKRNRNPRITPAIERTMAAGLVLLIILTTIISSKAFSPRAAARKEVFTFFSGNTPQGFYNSLPMQNITTIGLFSDHPDTEFPGLMKLARSHGTKVVKAVGFDDKQVPPLSITLGSFFKNVCSDQSLDASFLGCKCDVSL